MVLINDVVFLPKNPTVRTFGTVWVKTGLIKNPDRACAKGIPLGKPCQG